ncbi:3-hydroxyacyl-CoA dehydrogenase family protein [Nonomuraea sp. NPDC050153]|uniref:3-hydroxyacyl-CoA dehydrogenase family protein n=1 Tax=Nonomuraea sp. NPDC050153 TaxID=3364359 RepID=UPI0037891F8C
MKRIGVIGAGTMGTGVSQLFAESGHDVVLVDLSEHALKQARMEILQNVRMTPLVNPAAPRLSPAEVIGRIHFTTDLEQVATVDFVVENITENWDAKRQLYRELDKICPPEVPFGVNTSAIPITRIASVAGRAPDVIGTHFMNPAPLKPTVEVIRAYHTSDNTLERTRSLIASAGKNSIVVKDSPGFVTNRILMVTLNEAIFLLQEGIASPKEIDRLSRECFAHSMGPLATADLIGLDTVLFSLEVLHANFQESKYRPCPLLRSMVDAGLLGRKTGRGFHSYETAHGGNPENE